MGRARQVSVEGSGVEQQWCGRECENTSWVTVQKADLTVEVEPKSRWECQHAGEKVSGFRSESTNSSLV